MPYWLQWTHKQLNFLLIFQFQKVFLVLILNVSYHTEENFGEWALLQSWQKKNFDEWALLQIWRKKILANWTEFVEKNCSTNASVHQRSTRWRRGMHVHYK